MVVLLLGCTLGLGRARLGGAESGLIATSKVGFDALSNERGHRRGPRTARIDEKPLPRVFDPGLLDDPVVPCVAESGSSLGPLQTRTASWNALTRLRRSCTP